MGTTSFFNDGVMTPAACAKATYLLQIKLKEIRDRFGKHFDGKPLSTKERQEISSLLSATPDLLLPDSEGYPPLGEINHWTRQGVFPDDLLDEAIECHNRRQGLAGYDSDNESTNAIRRAISSMNVSSLETLLKDPNTVAALNYIPPRGRSNEGTTLLIDAVLRCNSDSKDHQAQIEVVRCLLRHRANPSIPRVIIDDGRPTLHNSVFAGDYELTKALIIEGKANPMIRGCVYRVTVMHYTVMTRPLAEKGRKLEARRNIVEFLLKQPGVTPYAPPGLGPKTRGKNAYEEALNGTFEDKKLIQLFKNHTPTNYKETDTILQESENTVPNEVSHENRQESEPTVSLPVLLELAKSYKCEPLIEYIYRLGFITTENSTDSIDTMIDLYILIKSAELDNEQAIASFLKNMIDLENNDYQSQSSVAGLSSDPVEPPPSYKEVRRQDQEKQLEEALVALAINDSLSYHRRN
jgi:hypothetical protein